MWINQNGQWVNTPDVEQMGPSADLANTGYLDQFSSWLGNKFSGPLFNSPLQQKDANGVTSGGWLQAGLGAVQGLGNLYLGMQQYGLAKDQLAANKEQFAKNYSAQVKTTNTALEDRQRARVASNPLAYQSVGDYMKQNGIA